MKAQKLYCGIDVSSEAKAVSEDEQGYASKEVSN